MKTSNKIRIRSAPLVRNISFASLLISAAIGVTGSASGQTPICGTINTTTWAPSGNPYIIGCDSTVPSGQTLTIQPGVVVWMGSNVTLTVNGSIQAVGLPGVDPGNRITFKSAVPSQYWNAIQLNYNGATNRFTYCDLQNANSAIRMRVYGGNATMLAEVMNCSFSNCVEDAIYGEAQGHATFTSSQSAILNPLIKNCGFSSLSNGCVLKILGERYNYGLGHVDAFGYANPTLIANVFRDLSGVAFLTDVGSLAGAGSAVFVNNTIANCQRGLGSQEPWDARIQDNIFVGCTNAVTKAGSLSLTTSYNDFYGNATNFIGYPASYGQWLIPNRNGTLADLFFNIGEDPLFVATNDFHLTTNSPCIDAGTPDWGFTDMAFPPSQGNSFPDLGTYGGPDAANWLDVVPLLQTHPWMTESNGQVRLNWDAIPRSSYQVQFRTNLTDDTWKPFLNTTAKEKPVSQPIAATNHQSYFRIESLGRTPGN